MSAIVVSHLSFACADGAVVFDDLTFAVPGGRTGLVAPNGTGKSALLELVAGKQQPAAGSITVHGALGYLPQTLPLDADRSVADVLGVAPVTAALDALAAGDASEAVFAAIGDCAPNSTGWAWPAWPSTGRCNRSAAARWSH